MFRSCVLTGLFLAFTIPTAGLADNWPQWRGPKNDGHSTETGLPTEWDGTKNIVWKLKMPGKGSSTPCIWNDKLFLTTADGEQIVLMCVGTEGKERWKRKLSDSGSKMYKNGEGNDASASCSTDGKRVYTFAGNGKITCHDLDGQAIWDGDLQKYGKFGIQFGTHWTPALFKDRLYLQVMHRNAQKIVAMDAATGKEIWAVDRPGYSMGESPDTYASPLIWEGQGGPLLIVHGNDYCTAHKLEDGKEVWRVAGLNPTSNRAWRFVSCPLVTDNLIVVPSCKNGPTVALNPVGASGTIDPQNSSELWRHKATPDVVAPILVDDIVYLVRDDGLVAIEAKTGKDVYKVALGARQIYRANPVYADGKIYIVGREGITLVVKPGREFKVLATNPLGEQVYSSPAISNGRIYIRGWNNLYCIGTK